jgi:acetate kinase
MTDALLVLNAGSSSLKFSAFKTGPPLDVFVRGQFASLTTNPKFIAKDSHEHTVDEQAWGEGHKLSHHDAVEYLFDWGNKFHGGQLKLVATGHRVVHGGRKFRAPVKVDDDVLAELESLVPLAPLHQPHNIAAIRAVTRHAPSLPQVACFDTSFHRTQPQVARHFALPRTLTEAGIERYGFHGLSYEYIASQLAEVAPNAATGRTVVAHLGNGASLCALNAGVSVATTMGFTPLDGLVMGTRCGSMDPGVLLYLMDQHGMNSHELSKLLTNESGLLGVSKISSDMRTLLEKEQTHPPAAEAIDLFVYRIARELGSLAAAMQGLDAVVFTGGIGENAPSIRARVCEASTWLGLDFDDDSNDRGGPRISKPDSRVSAWVIPTDEELMIAEHTMQVIF